jgi:hypothetical protein
MQIVDGAVAGPHDIVHRRFERIGWLSTRRGRGAPDIVLAVAPPGTEVFAGRRVIVSGPIPAPADARPCLRTERSGSCRSWHSSPRSPHDIARKRLDRRTQAVRHRPSARTPLRTPHYTASFPPSSQPPRPIPLLIAKHRKSLQAGVKQASMLVKAGPLARGGRSVLGKMPKKTEAKSFVFVKILTILGNSAQIADCATVPWTPRGAAYARLNCSFAT